MVLDYGKGPVIGKLTFYCTTKNITVKFTGLALTSSGGMNR